VRGGHVVDAIPGKLVGGISSPGGFGHFENILDSVMVKQVDDSPGPQCAVHTQEVGNDASNVRGGHGGPGVPIESAVDPRIER